MAASHDLLGPALHANNVRAAVGVPGRFMGLGQKEAADAMRQNHARALPNSAKKSFVLPGFGHDRGIKVPIPFRRADRRLWDGGDFRGRFTITRPGDIAMRVFAALFAVLS